MINSFFLSSAAETDKKVVALDLVSFIIFFQFHLSRAERDELSFFSARFMAINLNFLIHHVNDFKPV